MNYNYYRYYDPQTGRYVQGALLDPLLVFEFLRISVATVIRAPKMKYCVQLTQLVNLPLNLKTSVEHIHPSK